MVRSKISIQCILGRDTHQNAILPLNPPQSKLSTILSSPSCLKVAKMKPMEPKNDHSNQSICFIQIKSGLKFESTQPIKGPFVSFLPKRYQNFLAVDSRSSWPLTPEVRGRSP